MSGLIFTLLGFCLGALTLWLPGHLLQRAITGRFDAAISLVLSCWLMFTTVLACQILGLPVTRLSVGFLLLLVCAWPAYAAFKASAGMFAPWPGMPPCQDRARMSPSQQAWALSGLALCTLMFIGALAVSPLNFYDYPIRWDLFPQVLLERQNLDWYPLRNPDGYKDYLLPDAMPQAVGASVWWLYAWSGTTHHWISGAFALAQYLALGSAAGRMAGALGARPVTRALVELLVLASPIVIRSLALRQEAGLLALSAIVCLWALCELRGNTRWLIIGSLAAAAMMSTREYAGFILLPASLAAAFVFPLPQTPFPARLRAAARFVAIALAAGLPWYLYVWSVTGNPFYTLEIPGLFVSSVAPVWTQLLNDVKANTRQLFYAPQFVAFHTKIFLVNTLPALLLLVPAALSARRWPALAAAVPLFVFLWFWASFASAGGYEFALRIILPGLVLTIILAVAWLDQKGLCESPRARAAWAVATALLMCHAGLCVIVDRFYFHHSPARWPALLESGLQSDRPMQDALNVQAAIQKYPQQFAGARILTINAYIATLNRHAGVTFVPPWSPQVAFLYDPTLTPTQKRHRLLDAGIGFLVIEPDDVYFLGAFNRAGLFPAEAQLWPRRLSLGNGKDIAIIPDDRPHN